MADFIAAVSARADASVVATIVGKEITTDVITDAANDCRVQNMASYYSKMIVSTSSHGSSGPSVSCRAVSVCNKATWPLPARSRAVENRRPSIGEGSSS